MNDSVVANSKKFLWVVAWKSHFENVEVFSAVVDRDAFDRLIKHPINFN